jgi:hypothetical protein
MGFTRTRVALGAGITALTCAMTLTAVWAAGPAQASTGQAGTARAATASARQLRVRGASGDLYYVNGEYIDRVPVAGGTPTRVVRSGTGSVTGIAIADGRLFWVEQSGLSGSLSYIALRGAPHVHVLVKNVQFAWGVVAAGGWLYWVDQTAIGRVRPSGAHLDRKFITPPQENGGGVANGLATDGTHLFFSRCQSNEVSRVDTSGHGLDLAFIKLPRNGCPQGLAVGNDHLYWTVLDNYLGRATLAGKGATDTWLNVHAGDAGPFFVAADNASVYWDWGGVAESPMHVGRANVNGSGADDSVLTGQGAFLLTAPGAGS